MTCFYLTHETRLQITFLPRGAGERDRGIVIVTFITTS